mgnify:FL=1
MAGDRFTFITTSDDRRGTVIKSDDQKNKQANGTGVVNGNFQFDSDVTFNEKVNFKIPIGGNTSILTGSIANGKTIPVPSGYTRSQCKYIVSTRTVSSSHGNHNQSHNHHCYVDNNTGYVKVSGIGTGSGTANYMVIASK